MIKLYLDDERTPKSEGWTIVRSYQEFVDWITLNGIPDIISFDHDIASFEGDKEFTGHDAAKWLINWMMDNNNYQIINFNVHSANPVGAENIKSILNHWNNHLTKNNLN